MSISKKNNTDYLTQFFSNNLENSDKEFTCDLKDTILSTDLINGEKTTSESFSTWRVKVNISEEKLLFGRGGYLRGCGPLNDSFRLTISESQLLCQEEYEGKVRYEGGIKKSKSESGDFIFNNLEKLLKKKCTEFSIWA